ncbi:MAG: aspartyl protease family protein, partial [Candidatus Hodarchaeota archaeon]
MNAEISAAEVFFAQGKFEQAEKIFQSVLEYDEENFPALLQLGRINLFKNRFSITERLLRRALDVEPENKDVKKLLAQLFYRQDRFKESATYYQSIDQIAIARKLKRLQNVVSYQFEDNKTVTSVKFLQTDPLPVLTVSINSSESVNFVIDSGGDELVIDTDFAKSAGIDTVGSTTGTFAGGKQAPVEHSTIDSIAIGDFSIKNIPVSLMPV